MLTAPTLLPADAAVYRQHGVISGSIAVGSTVAVRWWRWQRWQRQLAGSAVVAAAAQQWWQQRSDGGGSTAVAGSVAVGQWQRAAQQRQR